MSNKKQNIDQSRRNSKPPSSKSQKPSLDYPKSLPENSFKTNETSYSFKSSNAIPSNLIQTEENTGESVRVALRIRPMNNLELTRNDQNCVKVVNEGSCQILLK